VPGAAGADFLVGRIRGRARDVAHGGDPHARHLPEFPLRAPEAAEREHRLRAAFGIGAFQRMAGNEMLGGGGNGIGAAGEGFAGGGHCGFLAREKHSQSPLYWLRHI
jgi:hypothetical protein